MTDPWNHQNAEQPSKSHDHGAEGEHIEHPSPPQQQIPTGSGLGKYHILERIRKTHNAILYKARDAMLDRLVTVKQMDPTRIDDPVACGDFKREAQMLARIPKDARSVIHIHELIEVEKGLFIVEEYESGDWLETLISKRQADATDAVRLLRSICRGLVALHSQKIVHRDISPSNLIVTESGMVRITNLSCATREGDATAPALINHKYAAPELQAGQEHDARVDIYALGMVMYEVCVGRRALRSFFANLSDGPEPSGSNWKSWHTDLSLSLPDATTLNSTVQPALSSILRRMTAKDLDHRYAAAHEILEDIEKQFQIQQNPAPAHLPPPISTRILEIRPAMFRVSPVEAQWGPLQLPGSFSHMIQQPLTYDQSTSTHRISPLTGRDVSANENRQPVGDEEWQDRQSWDRRRSTQKRYRRSSHSIRHRPSLPTVIPIRQPAQEPPHHPKRRHGVLLIAAFLSLLSAIVIIPLVWDRFMGDAKQQRITQILTEANTSYNTNDFQTAVDRFHQVVLLCDGHAKYHAERNEAELMILLVSGQDALGQDKFAKVKKILQEVENRSMTPATITALESLRDKYWSKLDTYRLAAEGNEAIKLNRWSQVEIQLDEFKKKARVAGVDPSLLENRLEWAKKDRNYEEALEHARVKMEQDDFEAAQMACSAAESIHITSATRELRKEIVDAQRRANLIIRGDKAMIDKDYAAAESAYQSANEIKPTDKIEHKVRQAAAARMVEQARSAIQAGNLLLGERLLKSSMWKSQNAKAMTMLDHLSPAFQAAQLAHNADRAMKNGDFMEAVRLYEKALPKLPAPADKIVQGKLNRARKATTQPETVGH